MKIQIATAKMKQVLDLWQGDRSVIEQTFSRGVGFDAGNLVTIDTQKVPAGFLQFLYDVAELTEKQRVSIHASIHGVSADSDMVCRKPSDVATFINALKINQNYNAEIEIGGRWYPLALKAKYESPSQFCPAMTTISATLMAFDLVYQKTWAILDYFFSDATGDGMAMSGKDILQKLGLRFLQSDITEFEVRCKRAQAVGSYNGNLVACTGRALMFQHIGYGSELVSVELGTTDTPKKVIIESDLESGGRGRERMDATVLPFIRIFSLDLKRYAYVDVDNVTDYKFDETALDRLVLPVHEKSILEKLFRSDVTKLFGDVLQDKHGGMIILANGSSGVGKTLTAEVFAELTHRPLYVMEMAELGVDIGRIEPHLETIFRRVTKWNAVLLMDEADVFLSKRGENLERSVIVGIFLRMMDYYKGILFLTSNRAEVIDPAFKSRITIRVDYPNLDEVSRKKIWKIMLDRAGIKVKGWPDGIPNVELNGRQIRNMVRLVKVIHGETVTADQLLEVCQFACK